jgi:hypothetical protein
MKSPGSVGALRGAQIDKGSCPMSMRSGSVPTRTLQVISLMFAGVAIASGWTTTTANLHGVDFWTAVASLFVIEVGALVGAHYLCAGARDRRWFIAACAAALAAICIGNAGSNGLNYAWNKHNLQETHRADARAQFVRERDAADAALSRAESALAGYEDVRATADIQADVATCEIEGCRTVRNKALSAEIDRATKRDSLSTALSNAKKRRAAVTPVVEQRSAAAAFVQRLLGADPDKVELGFTALYVALVVLAAPLCAGLAQLVSAPKPLHAALAAPAQRSDAEPPSAALRAEPAAPIAAQHAEPAAPAVLHAVQVAAPVQPLRASVPSVQRAARSVQRSAADALSARAQHVVQHVAAAGGELSSTYRRMQRELNMHGVTLGHAIKEAAAAGLLLHEASSRGTVLRLT